MEIHEYQLKALFQKQGIPILKGSVAYTGDEAVSKAAAIGGQKWVVKAQIYENGRGRGTFLEDKKAPITGVFIAKTPAEVGEAAAYILGKTLCTASTPKDGKPVEKIYIEEYADFQNAFAISFFIDRITQGILCTLSKGEKLFIQYEITDYKIPSGVFNKIVSRLKFKGALAQKTKKILKQLYEFFIKYGVLALEARPIIVTQNDVPVVLDARVVFDPDALFRFPDIQALQEVQAGSEREAYARSNGFRYTKLGGNIACLVNGLGLGLATLDSMTAAGGKAACLIDVGSEPAKETVAKAFKLALSEPNIDGILVNIFGGTTRCDIIAAGLIEASNEISVGMPIVVRMDGTNSKIGIRILFESRLPFTVIEKMSEAVREIMEKVKEAS